MVLIGVREIVRVDSMREFYESAHDYKTGTMISAIGLFNEVEALGRTVAFYYEQQGNQGYLLKYSTEGGRFAGRPKCIGTTEKTDQGLEWRKAEEFV